ncbi:MAG TPA: hypothetical protein ENJ90_08310 [Devosia sp.]|nr:hypothetical protein [Devosia sp.]
MLIFIYSLTFMGAFVFLFLGLQDFISNGPGIVQSELPLPPLSSTAAINIGLALLGASAVSAFATVMCAARAATNFGTGLVFSFEDVWDNLKPRQKSSIVSTARFGALYARRIMISLVPLGVFFLGIVYIISFNPVLGLIVLGFGILAVFVFVPLNMIAKRKVSLDFNANVDLATLKATREGLASLYMRTLDMFVARRTISSFNVFVLFIAFTAGFLFLGPERLVALFDEKTVVIFVIIRASILSLTRVTLSLKVANQKSETMHDVIAMARDRALPRGSGSSDPDEDEDEM